MNLPRYDTIVSPHNRNIHLKDSGPHDVDKMMITRKVLERVGRETRMQRVKDRGMGETNLNGVERR